MSVLVMGQTESYAGESRFFETLYDVPIMPGLVEIPDMALNFDKPDGRISQAGAVAADLKKQAVFVFYQESLGQMGWKKIAEGSYVREGEKLEIFTEKSGTSLLIRFLLQPL